MSSLLPMLAFLIVFPAGAQSQTERLDTPVPEEVGAFRKAETRYRSRLQELHADTIAYVELRESEERERLVGGYDNLVASLESMESSQRDVALEHFVRFLKRYPDATYASHVRFRLADLYFEEASEAFYKASRDYFEKLEDPDISLEELEILTDQGEPKLDLGRPMALYQKIIDDNLGKPAEEQYERLDGVFLMLGFCYNDQQSAQRDEVLARSTFEDLVRYLPESELADRSHLFLGNFLFADSDFEEAIEEYREVIEKGDEGTYFNEAVYQLAWARYKQSQYAEAQTLFIRLLDISEQLKHDTGRESPFAPDAKRFLAFSLADVATDTGEDALVVAERYFATVGERDYERDVYVDLADVLIRYTRPEEAIQVYGKLQGDSRWLNEADNPDHLMSVVKMFSVNPLVQDLEQAGAERLKLTEMYGEGSDWWVANRNNPDALAKARGYIESSLLDVAVELYVRAQETGAPADFAYAASKYEEYLIKFPISDDYYYNQFYLATAYKEAENWVAADEEFGSLIKSSKYHPYGDAAIYSRMDARFQQLEGAPDQTPADAVVARTYEKVPGSAVDVLELSEARKAFIESADEVVQHVFQDVQPEGLPDYRAAAEAERITLTYMPGQILYFHNQYDEMRPRHEALIVADPRTDEASYAAADLINAAKNEGDLEEVRRLTKMYIGMNLGAAEEVPDDWAQTLEGATFKLAGQQAEGGEFLSAAEAYLAFLDEFPQSQYAVEALHNAAFYYQEAGKKERANELYEDFVNAYPNDEKSQWLYFRIASNYEATFELEKAADYYDRLVQKFPGHVDAANALYNAARMRTGYGDHQGAAELYERYGRDYPDQPDREKVYFLAGQQYEQLDDGKALRFYQKYRKAYGVENPDHAIEAESRIAAIYERQGKDRAYQRQLDQIIDVFDKVSASGASVGAQGQQYAAQSEFRRVQSAYDDLTDEELTRNEDADAKLINETKPVELKKFEELVDGFSRKYQNFEYGSGALLLKGKAALYYADLGLGLEPPPGLDIESEDIYWELLHTQVFPKFESVEDVGLERLVQLIDAAKKSKRHSQFVDEAITELNRRRPSDYPDVKPEIRGGTDSRIPYRVLGIAVDYADPELAPDENEEAASPQPEKLDVTDDVQHPSESPPGAGQ